jgi:hypothetical protein
MKIKIDGNITTYFLVFSFTGMFLYSIISIKKGKISVNFIEYNKNEDKFIYWLYVSIFLMIPVIVLFLFMFIHITKS